MFVFSTRFLFEFSCGYLLLRSCSLFLFTVFDSEILELLVDYGIVAVWLLDGLRMPFLHDSEVTAIALSASSTSGLLPARL